MEIKLLTLRTEINEAIDLSYRTFTEFEAPVYPPEGVESFRNFLFGGEIDERLEAGTVFFTGAFADGKMAGTCAIRDGNHVTLMFVRKEFHRQGIGRMLMAYAAEYARRNYGAEIITLNSSPYGVPFYKSLGYEAESGEQCENGIIFTPMKLFLDKKD